MEENKKISLLELALNAQEDYENDIVLAKKNGKLSELRGMVSENDKIVFLTMSSKEGMESYRRSMTLMMLKAFDDVVGNKNINHIHVEHSVSKGLYCTYEGNVRLDETLLDKIENRMRELSEGKIDIEKKSVGLEYAISQFRKHGMIEKEKLFRYRRASVVNLYSINGFEDYYYGYMVPNTSYLKYFKLYMYDEGFVIQMPTKENPRVVPPFEPQYKVSKAMTETSRWASGFGIFGVADINDKIVNGTITDIILGQEAMFEKNIAELAKEIASDKEKKFIMIAGPSSSGKTTFARRLSIQLMAQGLHPHSLSVDNYFVEREQTPLDEDGNKDYECIEALDLKLFNEDMNKLLANQEIELPEYNFISGKKEYKGHKLKMEEDDILVIEGIHCLNERLSESIPKNRKYKVYLSALTTLNMDEHNRIPTTDARMLRRMIRDQRTRGISAQDTIGRWMSVRRGEEKYIFPYQEQADKVFNSILVYELSVLKPYVEPLLYSVPRESEEFVEAKKILKFLDYVLGINSEMIPNNSLIREFIGGSVFDC